MVRKGPSHRFPYPESGLIWNIIADFCLKNRLDDISLIDIGSNVGDTVCHFRSFSDGKVWAVEPSSTFLPFLQKNSKKLGDVEVLGALVCPDELRHSIQFESGGRTGSTAVSPDGHSNSTDPSFDTVSPRTLLNKSGSRVIFKTDTDGFDWAITAALAEVIEISATRVPIVYLEGPAAEQFVDGQYKKFIDPITRLQSLGYAVTVFSNLGYPVAQAGTSPAILEHQLKALHIGYINRCAAVHYYDFLCTDTTLPDPTIDLNAPKMQEYLARDHFSYSRDR